MTDTYASLCDDFYVDMYINTKLALPTQRDTILAFFERVQKQFPSMGKFYYRENNYYLEEKNNCGQNRWVCLEVDRIGSGMANPVHMQEAYHQDKVVLELAPYMLSVSHLDIETLDLTYAMDFDYMGNHDEVIAEALFECTAFTCFNDLPQAKPIDFSPAIVVTLSDDYHMQARISIDSKTTVHGSCKREDTTDQSITLTFTIRQYPYDSEKFDSVKSFANQCKIAEELMTEKIVPNFVRPLMDVISHKRLT